jgi:pimeloyl-ACP methyl ester carboxylesterase
MLKTSQTFGCLVLSAFIVVSPVEGPAQEKSGEQQLAIRFDPEALPIPFQRFTTTDDHGRTITAYLSKPPKEAKGPLPVVLWIQGSGCQSLFMKSPQGAIGGGLQTLLFKMADGRFRVLCVEKPGVKFLDLPPRPGGAEGASEEFLKEHTLPRWAEANAAALRAVWTLPDIDKRRTLVIGHSEGALTAARVAAELPDVTHVAPLASAGPTQLHNLGELAALPRPGDQPGDADRRRDKVYADWQKILEDPDSITKYWMGHPYRRWSTFCRHNSVTELLRSKAKVYLAQGTEDRSSHISGLDIVRAELAAHGREVVVERMAGLDHGYGPAAGGPAQPGARSGSHGFDELFTRILAWFLN